MIIKVFISQPMNGRPDSEILAERNEIINRLKGELGKIEIIDSFIDEKVPVNIRNEGIWYLAKSLDKLSIADVAYFAKGWKDARGCIFEHEIALKYKVKRIITE